MNEHDSPASDRTRNAAASFGTRATAEAFARALDGGDLAAVGQLLASDCECMEGDVRASSARAVLGVLRAAASWAERGFDDVRPTTTVAAVSADLARLSVTIAWMRVPGRWHRLEFERTLVVGADGRIVRLAQRCDLAAALAFEAFARDSGAPQVPCGFGITVKS